MVKGTGLTEKRRAALAQASDSDGLEWYRGDTGRSATYSWLFRAKLVAWGWSDDGRQVLFATPAGRAALAERGGAE